MCYFSKSWHGEINFPNKRNVIFNISAALIPYILLLRIITLLEPFWKNMRWMESIGGVFYSILVDPYNI